MSLTLLENLERDIGYLEQNLPPIEPSGTLIEGLIYQGQDPPTQDEESKEQKEAQKLTDEDVFRLSEALQVNDKFQGPLDLSNNDLSDLVSYTFHNTYIYLFHSLCLLFSLQSALYLKNAIGREGAQCLTSLDLSNTKIKSRSGIYIGDALIQNPNHPVEELKFRNVSLEEDGFLRILEACNANKNIKSINLGYVSNKGLYLLAETLKTNTSLNKLRFQECVVTDKKWTDKAK